jgi:hypothetical protein
LRTVHTVVREYAVSTMLERGQPYSCARFDDVEPRGCGPVLAG